MEFILGQFEFADGREVFDWDLVRLEIAVRSYDSQFVAGCGPGGSHLANRSSHAIDVVERIGEPGAFAVLQFDRNLSGQFQKDSPQPFPGRRLAVKPIDVRRKNDQDRHDRAKSLHALDHVAAADLLNEFVEKPKRELLGHHVCHEKCAALRFVDSL